MREGPASQTGAAPLSDGKLGVFLRGEQLDKENRKDAGFSYSAVALDLRASGFDGVCVPGAEGGSDGLPGCTCIFWRLWKVWHEVFLPPSFNILQTLTT